MVIGEKSVYGKKGLSAIVVTLIIILLAIAAFAIISSFFTGEVEQRTQELERESEDLRLDIQRVTVEENMSHVTVSREGSSNLEVVGSNVVFDSGTSNAVVEKSLSIQPREVSTIDVLLCSSDFSDVDLNSEDLSVTVYPIVEFDGEEVMIESAASSIDFVNVEDYSLEEDCPEESESSGDGSSDDGSSGDGTSDGTNDGTGDGDSTDGGVSNSDLVRSDSLAVYYNFESSDSENPSSITDFGYADSVNNEGLVKGDPQIVDVSSSNVDSGSALQFDGNDYVEVTSSSSFNPDTFTISALVNFDGKRDYGNIIGKWGFGGDQFNLQLDGSGNNFVLNFESSGTKSVFSSTSPQIGEWYHVAATYDGNEIVMYVNGEREGSTNVPSSYAGGNEPLLLGAENSGSRIRFSGMMDEVRVYNSALEESEISDLYGQSISVSSFVESPQDICSDADGDGWVKESDDSSCSTSNVQGFEGYGDCRDDRSDINPGAEEVCNNSIDDDCDGEIDEGCGGFICTDGDNDGYVEDKDYSFCNTEVGDCNDDNSSIHPGAVEICGDNVDNDCDGQVDEGCSLKVSRYNFEEIGGAVGSTVRDVWDGNKGVIRDSRMSIVPSAQRGGAEGNAVEISGSGYVGIPHDESLVGDRFAIMGWVNFDSTSGGETILSKWGQDGEQYNLGLNSAGDHVVFSVQNSAGSIGRATARSVQIDPNRWYHVAGAWDGSELAVYVNGEGEPSSFSGRINGGPEPLLIGAQNKGQMTNFEGRVDDVRFYRDYLDQGQVVQVMEEGSL